jgi:hypothetical protein
VDAGQLTITFNGPSSKDSVRNAKDVELFNFTMAAQANLEIRQMSMVFDGGSALGITGGNLMADAGTVALYTDVKIWDVATNTVVWGPQDFAGTASGTYSAVGTCSVSGGICQDILFTEDITMNAGTSKTYKVTADVANSTKIIDGEIIRAMLDVSDLTSGQVKNLDNNSYLTSTDIVPGADLVGNDITVRAPALAVTLGTVPVSQTVIKGTTNVPFVAFNLAAGTGADMRVTSLTLTGYIDEAASGSGTVYAGTDNSVTVQQIVPSVWLKVDGAQIGETKSPNSTTGVMTFSNLNLVIPAGTTKVVTVYGNVSISAYANSDNELITFDIVTASTDLTVADPNGNSVTATGDAVNGANGTDYSRAVTIANTGTLTVAAAPTEMGVTDSRIVASGKTGVTMAKLKFTAQNEELKVTKMRMKLISAAAGANVNDDVISMSLYDGSTLVASALSLSPTASVTGTNDAYVDFNTINNFVVPKNGSKTMTVKVDLNTISGGADSGDEFGVDLDWNQGMEYRGTSGSTAVTTIGSGDIAGAKVVLRQGQPKVELVAIPTYVLTNGTQTLMKFKITAQDSDIAIKHVEIQTTYSGDAAANNMSIREEGGSDIADLISAAASSSGVQVTETSFDSEQSIAVGTSKVYEVRATVHDASAGETISTLLLGADTGIVTGNYSTHAAAAVIEDRDGTNDIGNNANVASEASIFIWSDMSAIPHTDTSNTSSQDWTNGRYIKVIPTDSQTMTFPGT